MTKTALKFANRTNNISAFEVMEFVKRANALQDSGKPVIHLSIGEPDFTAPPAVLAALAKASQAGLTQYTPALGIAPLRAAVANYYGERFNVDLPASRIVITAGASAALSLAACALVNAGDRVLMTDPSYPCNRNFIAAFDGIADPVKVSADTRFQMTNSLIDKHWIKNGSAASGMLLATPANPTGTSIPFDDLTAMTDNVASRRGFSIIDEIYLGLSYDSKPHSILEHTSDVIVTNSFSKFFHMTGWRLGWLVVPEHSINVFERLAQNLYICASALAQRAALACFEPESMAIYDARALEFKLRRDYLIPELKRIGFDIPAEPDGAFYIYLDCETILRKLGLNGTTALANKLLDEAHICLVPGADFGLNEPERYMRLSYSVGLPTLKEAVARLEKVLAKASAKAA